MLSLLAVFWAFRALETILYLAQHRGLNRAKPCNDDDDDTHTHTHTHSHMRVATKTHVHTPSSVLKHIECDGYVSTELHGMFPWLESPSPVKDCSSINVAHHAKTLIDDESINKRHAKKRYPPGLEAAPHIAAEEASSPSFLAARKLPQVEERM